MSGAELEFKRMTFLNDRFICVVWPHQASAKAHLPAELPRTPRSSFPSTTLCFTVCLMTKTPNTHTHAHGTLYLPPLFPTSGAGEQASLQMAGPAVLGDFMPAAGSSQTHRPTFPVTDFTRTRRLARIQIVLLAANKEQWSFCISGRISLTFPSVKQHLTETGCDTRVRLYPSACNAEAFSVDPRYFPCRCFSAGTGHLWHLTRQVNKEKTD